MKRILVINLGMKSIRSIVFDTEGHKLGTASRPIETYLNEEYVLQNPEEWWEKAATVVKESMTDLNAYDIDYLTVTASSSCLICIDKNGNKLYESIMVSDKRAVKEAKLISSQPVFKTLKDQDGADCDASFILPKILWIKNNLPDVFEQTYKFLSPNDYMIARLTDKYVTDFFNAQKCYFDVRSNEYNRELLNVLGIDINSLPTVYDPGTEIGCLTEFASEWLGLSTKTKVVLSSYDAICSFFGSGVTEEGEASDVSGTVTVFRTLTYEKKRLKSDSVFVTPYISKDMQIIGGSNNMGGGLIEWVKQCYYMNEPYPCFRCSAWSRRIDISAIPVRRESSCLE